MRDKVSNALFAKYDASRPAERRKTAWRERVKQDTHGRWDERWPVLHVSCEDALAFARWFGEHDRGTIPFRLPTTQQWDKAAGLYDRDGREGPFAGHWGAKDGPRIAVNGREPLPVDRDGAEESIFGCRDMAGNGLEWTRNLFPVESKTIPPEPGTNPSIALRGRGYAEPAPLTFDDLTPDRTESWQYLDETNAVGFRLVIDLDGR
jgi:formylglycine-generating enzyme required for sulfatase activity